MQRNFPVKKTQRHLSRRRIRTVALALFLCLSYLIGNLFRLQYTMYDYYRSRVYDQITTTSALRADRGNIYDRNMNLLATSKTEWRIFVSTRDIKKREKADGVDYRAKIADGLSKILTLERDALYKKISATGVLDVTVKASANTEEYEATLAFIKEAGLADLVFTEAQSARSYPLGTSFAHVLGFTGSDNQGLYGLEYSYESTLKGEDGYYLYAKDANGNALPSEYSTYVPAKDGDSLVTTLDTYIQTELEAQLESIRQTHGVQNRVTGIVMDTQTGGILAMATSSPFDPNDPYTLDSLSEERLRSSGYAEGSDEYKKLRRELLERMWSNKAVGEAYEPGSTFKVVTVSTALELGVASLSDTFSCIGYYDVGGWRIKCHKTVGHGRGFSLAYGLQMSCNPTMMQLAERIGAERFYEFIQRFGYFEKTGIDLPSEARTIFHKPENIGSTELATISFGQRFKVSVLSQLTAVAAVANGGILVTPHVVERVVNADGETVYKHETSERRRVISEEVAKTVADILEKGVSGDGGARNAYVEGYKVAAKTGTSQKFDVLDENGNSYLRIGSTVAFAPSDEGGIALIIVVDEPTGSVKYGSVVAAPYISQLLEKVLPYLEYEKSEESVNIEVENYVGMSVASAKSALKQLGLPYEIVGDGEIVLRQTPTVGERIAKGHARVILYTSAVVQDTVTVPSVIGLSAAEANSRLTALGINLCLRGAVAYQNGGEVRVVSQSVPEGAVVKRGTPITLTLLSYDPDE